MYIYIYIYIYIYMLFIVFILFSYFHFCSFYFVLMICWHCLGLLSNKWFRNHVESLLCMVFIRFMFRIFGIILFLSRGRECHICSHFQIDLLYVLKRFSDECESYKFHEKVLNSVQVFDMWLFFFEWCVSFVWPMCNRDSDLLLFRFSESWSPFS